MPGIAKKVTVPQKKMEEEEQQQPKEKIKFDIFNNQDADAAIDYKEKTVLDNVSNFWCLIIQDDQIEKPIMMKAKTISKKYDFFDDDE